jgi:putative ABC transport system substrate-binding protein
MTSVIGRRGFIVIVTASILASPLGAEAQRPATVARIGWLLTGSLESPETRLLRDAFREGLRERGYVEGQNTVIEYRSADGKIERFPRLASDLARLKLDLIVAGPTGAS